MSKTSGSGTEREEDLINEVEDWVRKCWLNMVGVAKRQGWEADEAEDIAQSAAVTALEIARHEPERLGAVRDICCRWMCGVAWNVGRAARTKSERRKRILQESAQEVRQMLAPRFESDGMMSSRWVRVWDAAGRALPPRQAEVVRLILQRQMDDAEVAAILDISETTARWHRNEATKTLRRVLSQQEQ